MSRGKGNKGSLVNNVVKGALAGAAGVWALDRVVWFLWNREEPETLEQEREARPEGLDPAHVIANRIAGAMGQELTPKQPHPAGIAAHYALGIAPGALYGALRHRANGFSLSRGALYGLGLFFLQDELANKMLGTSGSPTDYPWQAHTRGFVGHLALGTAMEVAYKTLDRWIR